MINSNNLIKYSILFIVVTLSTYMIPNCKILNHHAAYIGLLAGSVFVLLDSVFPHTVIVYDKENK